MFVWGSFNVVHPGHLRLLNFAAECGDFLVVGVSDDGRPETFLPEQLRLEGVRAISAVNYSFVLRCPAEVFIAELKPDVVVKGKEHEQHFNPEQEVVDAYGGRLLFSSGDVRFSSLDLLQKELREAHYSAITKPLDFPERHGFNFERLAGYIKRFDTLRVAVIGDLIVDEYITCDPLGMSQEDPTIVVTPIKSDLFVGGAGIVAAHARGLGAQVEFFGIAGVDSTAVFAQQTLESYEVACHLIADESRPTTLKQRYRARGKTLLRVSHLRQHDISQELIRDVLERMRPVIEAADLLIFSDFNYGCLPQELVDAICAECHKSGVMMVADSQASSQIGDVSRFKGMRLITPTEHEARLAVRDTSAGLVVLADALQNQSQAGSVFITMGAEGLLIHSPDTPSNGLVTDQLPAFNAAPKDVSGAGDSLMICSAMALAVGASVWESAYLGALAAACQVGRVGNIPLRNEELLQELAQ
ncbi:PfkB family carbohydrate kinase [Viridibacterium curvum]|uniref:PfkB family carbohydrate kinase n=1 Tax=Viridibacterium curvum TaxID=1101404 RepID=A0ABP9QLM5_9RHOO